MFLLMDGEVWDPDLELLREVVAPIDRRIAEQPTNSAYGGCLDGTGELERIEHFIGVGFAACQAYLAQTYGYIGIKKKHALNAGPKHCSGYPLVALINHAANYWKHHAEWEIEGFRNSQPVVDAFTALGCTVDADCRPLDDVLTTIAPEGTIGFYQILPFLEEWRDELRRAHI